MFPGFLSGWCVPGTLYLSLVLYQEPLEVSANVHREGRWINLSQYRLGPTTRLSLWFDYLRHWQADLVSYRTHRFIEVVSIH